MSKKSTHPAKKTSDAGKQAGIDARAAVLEHALAIIHHGAVLDQATAQIRAHPKLSRQDQQFALYLLRLVLKRYARYRTHLSGLLHRPWDELSQEVQLLLIMGAAQLDAMQIPAYACVDSMVTLAKQTKGAKAASGMINAILKAAANSAVDHHSIPYHKTLPHWLSKPLLASYGAETTEAILSHSLSDHSSTDLTIKPEHYAAYLERLEHAIPISPVSLRLPSQGLDIPALDGFAEGHWWVQDKASSLPIYGIRRLLDGASVLDLCAAPGGKTMQLASYGANVTALDRSESRLARLEENIARTGYPSHIEVICSDIEAFTPDTRYDVVLLDAPCSATGTLRRNPDILYHRSRGDIKELIALQQQMLQQALGWVRPGGHLLYATCSLLSQEGEAQIDALRSTHPNLTMVAFEGIDTNYITKEGYYRTLPFYDAEQGGMDGFFAACLHVS